MIQLVPAETSASQEKMQRAVSHASARSSSATASIVPVMVSSTEEPHKEMLVYTLLDTQSDTFVLDDVQNGLNVEAYPVKLKLSTITAVDSYRAIPLPPAYTRDFIPTDRSYIPTEKTALQWPHLKHLASQLPVLSKLRCQATDRIHWIGLSIGSHTSGRCHWKQKRSLRPMHQAWLEHHRSLQPPFGQAG